MLLPLKQFVLALPIALASAPSPTPAAAGPAAAPLDWDWASQVSQTVDEPVIIPPPMPPNRQPWEAIDIDGLRD